MDTSETFFTRAKAVIPGGVNSPVRAFGAVHGIPRFIQKGKDASIYDVDGNVYTDYVCSWGPLILGHAHPDVLERVAETMKNGLSFGAPTALEVEVAELIVRMVPHIDKVRMVNSGTEAVMSALRLARGFTGRDKIVKFDGCYHGHSDAMLVKAGSGALTTGRPDSLGVPAGAAQDTLVANYNDLESVEKLFTENHGEIAAVIVEPVAANMGVVPPEPGFLSGLRKLCDQNHALLIFDEVITGFRLAPGGAQEVFGVRADIVTFGKIIGGGMPVGAYAARQEIMDYVAPVGAVYQAGTLSGNPVAMAAGLAQLSILHEHPEVYAYIGALGKQLAHGLSFLAEKHHIPAAVGHFGSILTLFFHNGPVLCGKQARESNTEAYAAFFNGMLKSGSYFAPSQFEAAFLSAVHTQDAIKKTLATADAVFSEMESTYGAGMTP
ncbi:MAG: glutamate-1-semialdehyde 2,1-aminomutase [Ethanoligenens sp.]